MPIIKSALKKMRQDASRTARNQIKQSKLKEAVKSAEKSKTEKNVSKAYQAIDKAKKAGLMHKNKASRLKSKISKKI